jgi:hypothetical protein
MLASVYISTNTRMILLSPILGWRLSVITFFESVRVEGSGVSWGSNN